MTAALLVLLVATAPDTSAGSGAAGWLLPTPVEDVAGTVRALEAADQPLSAARLAELAGARAAPAGMEAWWRGLLQDGRDSGEHVGWEGRVPHLEGRLRGRRTAGAATRWNATAALGAGDWAVHAGGWGWWEGFGLLIGGPGRRPGPTADAGLGAPRPGVRGWTGTADPRAVHGGGASWRPADWVLAVAAGTGTGGGGRLGVGVVGRRSGAWRLATVAVDGRVTGGGASGRWRDAAWQVAWETAWSVGAGSPRVANALHLAWRRGRRLRGEVLVIMAQRGAATPLTSRHTLLGSDGGNGWAWRGVWRLDGGVALAGVVARSARRWAKPGLERTELLDLTLGAPTGGGGRLEVTYRHSAGHRPAWSDAQPWLPPRSVPGPRRRTAGVRWRLPTAQADWRVGLRSFAYEGTTTRGRRTLVSLDVRRITRRGLVLRGGWHQAWGDPVDLVGAISPLPGVVVTRHWGAWRSELWAGLALDGRHLGLAVAAHHRRAATGGKDLWELRAEAGLSW